MRQALELAGVDIRRHTEPLRSENAEVLRQIGLSEEGQRIFAEFSFDEELTVRELRFAQANCFKKNLDWEDDFHCALRTGLLLIGSGLNGDPIVLDLREYHVGFLSHDCFWEQEEEDPRNFFISMHCSVGQFFLNAVTTDGYPVDAYEAAAYTGAQSTGHLSLEEE